MLRFRADLRSLLFLGLYFVVFIGAWFFVPRSWAWVIPTLGTLCVLNFMVAITIHNSIHCPIFYNSLLNRVHQILLTLAFGSPATGYVPGHNLSHHKHLQTQKDNTRTWKMRFRWNLLNQLLFFFVMIPGIIRTENRFVTHVAPQKPIWAKRYYTELAFACAWKILWFALDWKLALLWLIIPNVYAVWGIFGTNFWQHDGCDEKHPYNHSRNFTGKLFNYLVCNNGYHGAHHMRPALHWSLYPEFHQKHIAPYIHPNLNQPSILKYLWQSCIYPGKRLDYLGQPLPNLPKIKDKDWVLETLNGPLEAEDMAEATKSPTRV